MEFVDIDSVEDLSAWAEEHAFDEKAHRAFLSCMSYIRQNLTYDAKGEVLLELGTNLGIINFKKGDQLDVYLVEINGFQFAMPYNADTFKYTDARIVDPDVPINHVKTN